MPRQLVHQAVAEVQIVAPLHVRIGRAYHGRIQRRIGPHDISPPQAFYAKGCGQLLLPIEQKSDPSVGSIFVPHLVLLVVHPQRYVDQPLQPEAHPLPVVFVSDAGPRVPCPMPQPHGIPILHGHWHPHSHVHRHARVDVGRGSAEADVQDQIVVVPPVNSP